MGIAEYNSSGMEGVRFVNKRNKRTCLRTFEDLHIGRFRLLDSLIELNARLWREGDGVRAVGFGGKGCGGSRYVKKNP